MLESTLIKSPKARGDRARGRAPTPVELRELDDADAVEPFTTRTLPDDEREQAEAVGAAATGLALKALLHRADPGAYPVPSDESTPEAAAVAVVNDIDDEVFARLKPRITALASDRPRLARVLAPLGDDVDLKRPSLQLKHRFPAIRSREIKRVSIGSREEEEAEPVGTVVRRSSAKYTRMDFVLRAVHCVRETSGGGADEIVLGAVLVGASGNTKVVPARFIGDFDDGTYISTGDLPFGQFSLRTTNGYPKTMYCILQLVESDQDDARAAKALTQALSTIVNIAVSALATPAAGVIAGAIVTAVGGLIQVFISDDAFGPYGIMIRLNGEDQFGSEGMSGKLRTGNITGHGGAYRIGYRVVMNA